MGNSCASKHTATVEHAPGSRFHHGHNRHHEHSRRLHFSSWRHHKDFDWPMDLHEEITEMADLSALIYRMGWIFNFARKHGLKGVHLNEHNEFDQDVFTTDELEHIVEQNMNAFLAARDFQINPHGIIESLDRMRANNKGFFDSLTIQNYDARFEADEAVFAIVKDDVDKRLTIVYRGTFTLTAGKSNILADLDDVKLPKPTPEYLHGKLGEVHNVWFHEGFYNFLFQPTVDDSDDPDRTKHDEITEEIKALSKKYPDYKIYVTGHSLGGSMGIISAYYLACDPELPKPITCFAIAPPRSGDHNFALACQRLESDGLLQICRVVNYDDFIPHMNCWNYQHVGFQVKLRGHKQPEITYPKIADSLGNKLVRTLNNNLISSLSTTVEHYMDYYQEDIKLDHNKDYLQTFDLRKMYQNNDWTGFDELDFDNFFW